VLDAAANDAVRSVVTELAVEPLRLAGEPDARYVDEQVSHLHERMVQSRVAEVRSQLQRIDPEADEYQQVFGELIQLEQQRRRLRERAAGGASRAAAQTPAPVRHTRAGPRRRRTRRARACLDHRLVRST